MIHQLKATTAKEARQEARAFAPCKIRGYLNDKCCYISSLRKPGDKAHVATASIPDTRANRFEVEVEDADNFKIDIVREAFCETCGHKRFRKELKWHRLWFANPHGVALAVHPEQRTFHLLCESCYDKIAALHAKQKEENPEFFEQKRGDSNV